MSNMKRASYRAAVEWIAMNDEPSQTEPRDVAGYISTCLIADLFGVEPSRVARDVIRVRIKERETVDR